MKSLYSTVTPPGNGISFLLYHILTYFLPIRKINPATIDRSAKMIILPMLILEIKVAQIRSVGSGDHHTSQPGRSYTKRSYRTGPGSGRTHSQQPDQAPGRDQSHP